MEQNLIEFKAKVNKLRYDNNEFKIYIVDINENKYKDINKNKRGEYVILGNLHTLIPGVEYSIKAEESVGNFGYQYKVINIRREKPTDLESSYSFLKEIINNDQANILLEVYPNIIDKVIKNDLDDIDLNKTKGIKEKTFEKIKEKIIENFSLIELIEKLGDTVTFSTMKKLYDKYSSVQLIERKLKKDPYKCLCELSRIGFKSADSILLDIEKKSVENKKLIKFCDDLRTSKERMKACIVYVLEKNQSDGNTVIGIQKLTKECSKLTPECMGHFLSIINENEELIHVDKKSKMVSLKSTYDTEKYIVEKIDELLNNKKVWNVEAEAYRMNRDIILTDEQINTINLLANDNIVILTAPGGAGKTESVKSVLNMLDERNLKYILMTPTGKSSEVLADYTGIDAGTIHRKLGYNPGRLAEGLNPWTFNNENKLTEDVVVVDEFSMVDIFLFKHLLDAIDTSRTKLLLVFDSYQLASVGCGNLAHEFLDSGKIPTNRLTKIFRYGEGGLMNVATKMRNSESFIENSYKGVKMFGTKKDFVFIQRTDNQIPGEVINIYKNLLKKGYSLQDIMVLTAQNNGKYGVKGINKVIQEFVQANKNNKSIKRGDTTFFIGDKVIQTKNNYKAQKIDGSETHIYNGNTGIITKVYPDAIVVSFKDKDIYYTKADLYDLELGYCFTIHRSQGDSCKQVIVVGASSHTFSMNSNLLYVAATRAKERCFLISNPRTINMAIKKKENLTRNTMAGYLLKEI